jgi:hypothetical protein
MQLFSNDTRVPLSVAVFLATDHYDYVPGVVSATALMKPLRQQVLPARIPADSPERIIEVLNVTKSRIGTAIHDSIEKSWVLGHYRKAMLGLGHPQHVIDRIVVNPGYKRDDTGNWIKDPDAEPMADDAIPVYMEIRSFKEIEGKQISGKFDFVAEGQLEDFKSTSTYTWVNDTKSGDYQLQGSIYRWLNPDIVTSDHMTIQFLFTNWEAWKTSDPKYPQHPVMSKKIPLLSLEDTEAYVRSQLMTFEQHKNTPEAALPRCTDKDLWRKDSKFKYYKNPAKTARSTANFDSALEANQRLVQDGGVGIVKEVKGAVVACRFCSAASVCTQKDEYIASGNLQL